MKKSLFIFALLVLSGKLASQTCTAPNTLVKVYKTRTANYEYVIFKLKKNFTGTYSVTPIIPPIPFDEGGVTPNPPVSGCKHLSVVFTEIDWMCVTNQQTGLYTTRIKDVVRTGQFEGVISYAVGYQCPSSKFLGHYAYDDGSYRKVVLRFRR